MARARLRWSWALAAYLAFPLILGAALWLARSSYRHAEEVAARAAGREREANRALAGQIIRRVDAAIIDADRTLFNLIDLEQPREFERLWRRIMKVSKSVEAVAVLNDSRQVLHFLTRDRKERESLKRRFLEQIVPDLELEDLGPDRHKHLHKSYDGKSKLVSYIRRDSVDGHARYVALDWRVNHLIQELVGRTVREELGPRQRSRRFAVVDEEGNPIYGEAGDAAGAYEVRFPTTFYRWRLRMAPRFPDPEAVAAGKQARRELALVAVSTVVTIAGLLLLGFSVRKERRVGRLHSDFAANLSHELKTPLSLIRMFSELIALGKLKDADSARQYGEIIMRESERLSHLIDNVMDFSRIERGQALRMTHGNLAEVVERVLDVYRPRLEREQVRLDTEIASTLPMVRMDENAMALVLLNLVENAVKYGAEGGEIAVRLEQRNGQVFLQVQDHGPGIPADEQKRVFDRFYRIKADRTQPTRGVGIGLSLVRQIAEAHGGRVSLESQPGQGSTFTVALPVAQASPRAPS